MTLLDPFTIIIMSSLMAGAMSIVLFAAHRSFPSEIQGLQHWAGGLLLLVMAALLYSARNSGPILGDIVVLMANSVLLWGIGLAMIGTQVFYGQRPQWRLFHVVWAVGMAGIGYSLFIESDFTIRVAIFSFLVSIFYCSQLWAIIRHGESHFSTTFFAALILFQTLVVLTRGLLVLFGGEYTDLMRPGYFQSLYLATSNFMVLLLAVGFMTVATRRLQAILERRSTLDPLTQVLNRRGFADIYAKERALLQRNCDHLTMLSIDLDFFKAINDSHGHLTGDRVLINIAKVIGKVLRTSDHLARFGGEEFVVLLPGTGIERALSVAERIQGAIKLPCEGIKKGSLLPACTVSIGLACQMDAEEDLDSLLMRADKALYAAKDGGRDRVEIADALAPAMRAVRA
ncbi:GGDEF domain-containing protein [Duganella aceris]